MTGANDLTLAQYHSKMMKIDLTHSLFQGFLECTGHHTSGSCIDAWTRSVDVGSGLSASSL